MANESDKKELKSTGYELFILLLSLVSVFNLIVIWVNFFYPILPLTLGVIEIINVILTLFFLFDFSYRILTTESKSNYFFRNWGWADLLACAPQLRIFRLFRVFRAVRLLRVFGVKNMIAEILDNRAGIALYITVFGIILIAEVAGIFILRAETQSPDANITTAGDAVWWILVTMTTVGYGDKYPVTAVGRILAVFVMLSGVALIGVLASFLSNFFLAPAKKEKRVYEETDPRSKLMELRDLLAQQQAAQAELEDKIAELDGML
ncbi:MAG: ion transporter [Candidatus Promineifilaceae bacterium]|nr:ion transporter [Candidatus Promineifilaceae bacterium]